MKMTLLQVVQDVLSSLNSDNVNSIDDTEESNQVATIVKNVYFEIISDRDWPHLQKMFRLDGVSDTDTPTHLLIPDEFQKVTTFRYDTRTTVAGALNYTEVKYCYPDQFLDLVMQRDSSNSNIQTVTDIDGATLLIQNDQAPRYWTTFDDKYIIADSFDSSVDSTLQSSKTQCLGTEEPTWSHTNAYQIDLPTQAFSYLLAESKSVAWVEINEQSNQKAEQQSRRQRTYLSVNKRRSDHGIRFKTDSGRK